MRNILSTCLLAMLAIASAWGKDPDFRYPATVIEDATEQIENASRRNDREKLIDGLIRLSIAKSKISADNMPEMIRLVDSVACRTSDRAARALMRSFEADMYLAFYRHDSYKYDNRLQADTPADIREWSRQDFTDKIVGLSDSILADSDLLLSTPVDDYRKIIILPDVCREFAPSLLDMLAHHAIDQISEVADTYPDLRPRQLSYRAFIVQASRVEDNAQQRIDDIYRLLLTKNRPGTAPFIYTELQRVGSSRFDSKDKKIDYLLQLHKENSGSPYSSEIIADILKTDGSDTTAIRLARETVKRYPKYDRINALKQFIADFDRQTLGIRAPKTVSSRDSIPVDINSANVENVTIKVYSIPEDLDLESRDDKLEELLKGRSPMKQISASLTGQSPQKVMLPPLPLGRYLIVPEFTDRKTDKRLMPERIWYSLRVTDINIMMTANINDEIRVFAVDAATSAPLHNAIIHCLSNTDDTISVQRINRLGYAVLDKDAAEEVRQIYATYRDDRSDMFDYYYHPTYERDGGHEAIIYTDRSVYRPGETVKYAAVVYQTGDRILSAAAGQSVKMRLRDANGKILKETELVTDKFGRCDGEMTLPAEGLTGQFRLEARRSATGVSIGARYMQVSEYKAPTFYIEAEPEESSLSRLDSICVRGKIMTYSQFPMADTKLSYNISQSNYYWYRSNPVTFEPLSGSVTTDADGNWSISIPAENFSAATGKTSLSISLSATDAKGESQTQNLRLNVGGTGYFRDFRGLTVKAGKDVAVPFSLVDNSDRPLSTTVKYDILQKDDTIASGTFRSDKATIDLSPIPSGKYELRLSLPGEPDASTSAPLIVYRETDTLPPFTTPLFLPDGDKVTCAADGSFSFPYSNSFDNHFYYVILNAGKIVEDGWHAQEAGSHRFEGKAEFSDRGASEMIIFQTWQYKPLQTTIKLNPAIPQDSIEIVTATFRDNITPGARETWKLRIKNNNGKKFTSAVIVNMYDAALDAVAPANLYALNPYYYYDSQFRVDYMPFGHSYSAHISAPVEDFELKNFFLPYLNTYKETFFAPGYPLMRSMSMSRLDEVVVTGAVLKKQEAEVAVAESANDAASAADDAGGNGNDSPDATVQLRDDGIKTAFFLPGLVTDENGEVTFTFDVPNRNTQWQFSAVAYTDDMRAAAINRTVTASKPLMVEPNLPRFVRKGDSMTLKATVMNNSDIRRVVDVVFELANGDKTATEVRGGIEIAPKGAATVDIPYAVADGTSLICTVTVTDENGTADGERSMIAILPATASVIEAEPFYLTGKEKKLSLRLPEFGGQGTLTFEYCDNPAWYAATALPSILSESATASAFAANYFSTTAAGRIVADNRAIAEAIRSWDKEKSLKSNLEKNAELKTVSLSDTPWVNAAETETASMEKLIALTDSATIQYRQQRALIGLSDLQQPDGGISWFNSCKSSIFTTEEVLRLMASLNEMGYYDNNDALLRRIVTNAVAYCDRLYTKCYRQARTADERKSLFAYAADYMAIRSSLPVAAPTDTLRTILNGSLDYAAENWGNRSIAEKSEWAVLLANNGRTDKAAEIVESLRQTAVKKAGRGMYWDIDYTDKTALAAAALRAFRKIDPNDSDIDEIRLWLLLQKETQWWRRPISACRAVGALLATGTDWTTDGKRKMPKITVGGISIKTDDATPYFGYVKRTLEPAALKSQDILISRTPGVPAWGAVFCRYDAKMEEIEKQSSPDIRIDKQFFVYDADGSLKPAPQTSFKVGDRVQVRLTIRTERDLDFAALTDDRAACFEPIDQTAAYSYQDGAFAYRETRDDATNLFISSIRKGSYIVSYDVFVNTAGQYASGIATLQCQYAPQLTAHSSGASLSAE